MSRAKQNPDNVALLLEVSRLLSSKLELSELLHIIIPLAAKVLNADRASLFLVDEATQELYFDVAMGLPPEVSKIRLKMGQGIAGTCAKERKAVIIADARKDPRWYRKADEKSGYVTRSIIAVPLLHRGRLIGVAQGLNKLEGTFTLGDLRAFEAFASQAAVAIENARLFNSLKEERRKLGTLLNEMRDAALLTDGTGGILLANAAAKAFFAQAGSSATLESAVEGMAIEPSIANILRSPAEVVEFEARRETPKRLVLAGTATRIAREAQGGSPGRVVVFRDITEEKYEEALKRNFLSLISHKLKTPLSSITGYSQLLLLDQTVKKAGGMLQKGLDAIHLQGSKLATLVDKLLNFTLLEELDSRQDVREIFPVAQVLRDAVSGLESWLIEHAGSARVDCGESLTACGDPALIRDAVKNLIENGVKFAAPGSRDVVLRATKYEGKVEIAVADKGPGIPPEETEKIFKRFYQIESSFTGQVEGWGLGLPFVKKAVEKSGGALRVESKLQAGTTVFVTLPGASDK